MAKPKTSSTYSRTGTTVNVSVPRGAYGRTYRTRGRTSAHRPAAKTSKTTTRTLSQVYTPSKGSNTPLIIGGAVLAAAALYLLLGGTASAAEGGGGGQGGGGGAGVPGMPGTPGTPGAPGGAFPTLPGASTGYAGPGSYRTTAPSGLNIRPTPKGPAQGGGESLALVPIGTTLDVVGDAGNGWFQVSSPVAGFMCASCAEAPGGPWLVRQA